MVKKLFGIFIVLLIPLLAFGVYLFIYIQMPATPTVPFFKIEKGASFQTISHALAQQGIIRHPRLFRIYAQLKRQAHAIKAGDYLFEKEVTPEEVLQRLYEGLVYAVKIRLIEGWTAAQIADAAAAIPENSARPGFKTEWLRLLRDPAFIASLGLQAHSLEGYLFPDTYDFSPYAAPADYLKTFVGEFQKRYAQALVGLKTLPPLSQHQIVTLASIIEKEAGAAEERPIVASVFYNRLKKGMPLQSDPTTIYGLKNFNGNITKKDLSNPHAYNTYIHKGLPPGPICSPGMGSLKAALFPAKTDYLFFVSRRDGTHQFSRTVGEHIEAVRKYQLSDSPAEEVNANNEQAAP